MKYSANTPFILRLSAFAEKFFPAWRIFPSCTCGCLQSGVIDGTTTISPILKSLTFSPTSTTLAIASCPSTRLSGFLEPVP